MTNIGIVGIGNWGKNLVRVADELTGVDMCCHTGQQSNAEWMEANYPHVHLTTDYDRLVAESDAILIATPIPTHYDLAKRALDAGCHVFVEKPMAETTDEATELATTAASTGQVLFAGYLFVHHPVFREILAIHNATPIQYAKFEWAKLGSFGSHIIPNLASHDLAMAYALFGESPHATTVSDAVHAHDEANIISLDATFTDARCRIDIDRLAPTQTKRATFHTEADEVYHWTDTTLQYLDGDEYVTAYESSAEPLERELSHFFECVTQHESPITDGSFGLAVTQMMHRFNYPDRRGQLLSD